ncbi:Lipopolysaccharide assembly protein B [BD1-7 clade bacterium]|uniref:Lipopolysaccharide assembly protein B n=1 Tax=BD1-7 clade bacterium TaxID=2029982 RepID=A0A5S9N0G3_9GAMM|nr:Lipopolysaccharide assembly protein B [BD1-7 clade bacterium]
MQSRQKYHASFPSSFRLAVITLLVAFVTACVTSEPKLFQDNVSKDKEVEARVQIGLTYLNKGEPEKAIMQLKRALDVNPDSARVNEVLALAFENAQEYDVAKDHFKRMLSLDSSYTRGRANYGYYLMRRQDFKEAYKQLNLVIADIYYSRRAAAFQQLGYAAAKIGKKDDEVEYFYTRALGLDESLTSAMIDLAQILYKNEVYAKSQIYLDRYREKVRPSSAEALLLGIKLARVFEDKHDEASYALALRNLYPRSKEYLEYIKDIRDADD